MIFDVQSISLYGQSGIFLQNIFSLRILNGLIWFPVYFSTEKEYAEEWTEERIAESFPVSVEGAKLLLKSKWKPRYVEDLISHDRKVQKHWLALKSGGKKEGGPIANTYVC